MPQPSIFPARAMSVRASASPASAARPTSCAGRPAWATSPVPLAHPSNEPALRHATGPSGVKRMCPASPAKSRAAR